jgi:hypothetical protein
MSSTKLEIRKMVLAAIVAALSVAACGKQDNQTPASSSASVDPGSPGSSVPAQLQVVGHYNIVKFKGMFYACPHGLQINWDKDDPARLAGVLMADSQEAVIAKIPH